MNVQNAIMERRSTRGFDGVALTDTEIQTLLDAALASPSAINKQPWHFTFVKNAEVLAKFDAEAKEIMLKTAPAERRAAMEAPDYKYLMGAPLFVTISKEADDEGPFTPVDCGIAVENLALSAMGLGLGSVIVGSPRMIFDAPEKGAEMMKLIGIPEGNSFVIGILIGHNTVTKDAHPIGENKYTII